MKKSTLSLLLALGVFFSLNGFADDKVTCYKLRKNGKLKDSQKKSCNGTSWHDSIEKAVAAAKAKCDQKKQRSGKHEWKETDGKDGKGRCVKTKGLFAKKLFNNAVGLESNIENFCLTEVFKDEKLCKKAKRKYVKVLTKSCKKEYKKRMKERNKSVGSKIKSFFSKKKNAAGVKCKDAAKQQLTCVLDESKCAKEGGN